MLMYPSLNSFCFCLVTSLIFISCIESPSPTPAVDDISEGDTTDTTLNLSKASLGEKLFLDENLSLDRTMSCATCHNPDHGFIDSRVNSVDGAVSIGQDGSSLGDRNSPMISYASFTPTFQRVGADYFGGQFLDGRASDLVEQAQGPFLDNSEMQMPTKLSVVQRVMEDAEYLEVFKGIYGDNIFNNSDQAYVAIADAITEFEKTDVVSPFDSQFDTGALNAQELRGQALFRAARCTTCHTDNARPILFTDFSYKNLGVPTNTDVRSLNGKSTDQGLFQNPNVAEVNQLGKFRVPSLRNVGVTSPYMHNGIFQNLKTVVHFYNTRDVPGALNPETNLPWGDAELNSGVETRDVGNLGLSDSQEDDIVSFLLTLTDRKFEDL